MFVDVVIYEYRIGDIREDIIAGTYDVSKPAKRKRICANPTEEENNKRLNYWQLKCACQVSLRG